MFDNNARYGLVTRYMHWGMALLILWQFLTAGSRVLLEDTAVEEFMWGTHMPLGFLLLLLIAIREGVQKSVSDKALHFLAKFKCSVVSA